MPLMPGAEPYERVVPGAKYGVLLCHGFSGSPASMRPWAEHLADEGFSVTVPRLPGHGTRWQDMNLTRWTDWYGEVERALLRLAERCERVAVAGMSMGGTLAIRLTEQYAGRAENSLGDRFIGTMLVNPSLATERKDAIFLPLAQRFIPAFPGISNDIAKPGVDEVAYSKLPLKAAYSLQQMWRVAREDLLSITTPVLLYQSRTDHVVEAVSSKILLDEIRSSDVTHRILPRSYHVATLDYDAEFIFTDSTSWLNAHATEDSDVERTG